MLQQDSFLLSDTTRWLIRLEADGRSSSCGGPITRRQTADPPGSRWRFPRRRMTDPPHTPVEMIVMIPVLHRPAYLL